MNIRDLEYLVALAEHRHFRRAADSCHVSQPTLSGQIRKLEDELGVMLLERTSRKVLFTQAGLLLVDQARTVLREVKVLKEMASQQGETMSGPLHIGLIPTIGPYLLPQIIPMLHQTFPKLEMYLHEAQTHQLLAQLDSGKLDCAILALVKESEAFIEVPLFDEPMMLAIYEDHPWANRDRVPMSDLAGEKLLMLEDGHCLRDQAMGFCFEAGADDYMVKPFIAQEFVWRITAILRRTYKESEESSFLLDACKVDLEQAEVYREGQEPVSLTAKEVEILKKLYANAGRIVTLGALCQTVCGDIYIGYEKTLMSHIRHIREKIEINPKEPRYLKVVWGLGYKIEKI